jgi:amidase
MLKNQKNAFVETFHLKPYFKGPLDGMRFAVKDLFDVRNHYTRSGNPTWKNTHPVAVVNAVSIEILLASGAECIGKTIMDELAYDLTGENFFYGTPLNPKAPNRVPGGSSSGSASAVACGLVDFALGTDTGGSVRVPASNCGIYGYRPTHGTISMAGVLPLAPSLDTVGVLAPTNVILSNVALVLLSQSKQKNEVGDIYLLQEAFDLCDADVKKGLENGLKMLKKQFHKKVKEVSIGDIVPESSLELLLNAYRVVHGSEIWSSLGSWIKAAKPAFGPRVKINFRYAQHVDRTKIKEATLERERCFRAFLKFLNPNDLLCFPTTPALAPIKNTLGADRFEGNYFSRLISLTMISGLGRLPEVSVPIGDVDGVPIGLSLLGAHGQDAFLLRFCEEHF